MTIPSTRTRRHRRPGDEIRRRAIEAAGEVFAEYGYGGTTREIARRAGISEALIFTHFGTKRGLFEAAVVTPITSFLADYLATEDERLSGLPPEEYGRLFERRFIDLIIEKKSLLRAYFAAGSPVANGQPHAVFQEFLDQGTQFLTDKLRDWGLGPLPDPWLTSRIIIGARLAVIMFDDWLFPPGQRPDPDRIVEELIAYHFHGVAHRSSRQPLPIETTKPKTNRKVRKDE